jgi:hypothetical protein
MKYTFIKLVYESEFYSTDFEYQIENGNGGGR